MYTNSPKLETNEGADLGSLFNFNFTVLHITDYRVRLFGGFFFPTMVVKGHSYQSGSLKLLSIKPSQSVRVSPIFG